MTTVPARNLLDLGPTPASRPCGHQTGRLIAATVNSLLNRHCRPADGQDRLTRIDRSVDLEDPIADIGRHHRHCRPWGGISQLLHDAGHVIMSGHRPRGTVMRIVLREVGMHLPGVGIADLHDVCRDMLFDEVDSVIGRARALDVLCYGADDVFDTQLRVLAHSVPRTTVADLWTLTQMSLAVDIAGAGSSN